MPFSRLLYTSNANFRVSGTSLDARVREIAQAAARRNKARQITGALVFVDGQFIQVIEGPSENVEALFETICCDFNHSQIRLVDLIAASERLFADWDMAALSAESETTLALRPDLEEIRFMVGVNARVAIEQMRNCLMRNDAQVAGAQKILSH